MFGIPVALAVFGAGEWVANRYLLDTRDHDERAQRNGGYDPAYEGMAWTSRAQGRELVGLIAIVAWHLPLAPVAPFYTATMLYCLHRYRRDHRRAHLDPAWARDHLPHHYAHHVGDRERNFGVVWSWVDTLAKTREIFVGTAAERAVHSRNVAKASTASSGAPVRAQRRNPLRRLLTVLPGSR
ncbi:MAG TPA: hypothetical protein VGM90_30285 [Kofleriaceae bacterium]|jgi:hypothetical protein